MKKEYLEDYEKRENEEYEKLLGDIRRGSFSYSNDKYPRLDRFVKIKRPIALADIYGYTPNQNIWAQIPFSGSLILMLAPISRPFFEKIYFAESEIPKIIDFVKETGKLQFVLTALPTDFEGFDYLEPFFTELNPPCWRSLPLTVFGNDNEIQKYVEKFHTKIPMGYQTYLKKNIQSVDPSGDVEKQCQRVCLQQSRVYSLLQLRAYNVLIEDFDAAIIDYPEIAYFLLTLYAWFIADPMTEMLGDVSNFSFEKIQAGRLLPQIYQTHEPRFPCEIGKFLLRKLTYAPQGLRACNELIDHYDAYDLQKVHESLNEAIKANNPDILNKNVEEFSDILDNIWNDRSITKQITGLRIGLPLSVAAIGYVAAGPIAAIGGLLAGLGFDVLSKTVDIGAEQISEKLVRRFREGFQVNIYDFKKKYKGKIAQN